MAENRMLTFTIDEILKHEKKLYPEEKRFTKEELISQRKNYI